VKRIPPAFVGGFSTLLICALAAGQDAAPRADAPPVITSTPTSVPTTTPPSPPAPAPIPPISREAQLEERLRKLEERYEKMERRHDQEYKALSNRYDRLRRKVAEELGDEGIRDATDRPGREGLGAQGTGGRTNPAENFGYDGGGRGGSASGSRDAGGFGAQGTDARTEIRELEAQSDWKPMKRRAKVTFAEGLEFSSSDDEFKLTFHDLTQAEYRGFPTKDQGTLKSQFFLPRQRWYFTGQATKNVEFYTDINRGYGTLDLLDAFITLNIGGFLGEASKGETPAQGGVGAQGTEARVNPSGDTKINDAIRLRVGRMKTPYLWEYFSIAEGDLIAPERSLYASNFALNREIGAMILGNLAENRIGYAMGIFNGPRRSFEDSNSDKDVLLYLNTRPFLKSESLPFLNYLNIGGCINGGFENGVTQPGALRTANDQTPSPAAASLSPTFMTFNSNVSEHGERVQWSGHVAYFYKSLMIISEYGGGFQNYTRNNPFAVTVPIQGWMVQASYFLTGEQLTRRVNVVRPVNLFGYHDGHFGWGAIEVHSRFSELNIGQNIFTAGLADPNLWSNQAYAIDTGMNWYLNFYTKVYLDWQHAVFGNPVTTGVPGRFMRTTDLFWLRFQIFF
jgi:phosphate-selective porin OprO and OprP